MNKIQKLFFIYCAILALFISISGILNIKDAQSALYQLAFLPVPLYFVGSVIGYFAQKGKQKKKKEKGDIPLGMGFSTKGGRIAFVVILFLVLLATSARRILTANNETAAVPETNMEQEGININDYIIEPVLYVLIKSDDASQEINVREKPTTSSDILDKVVVDDEYEYVSEEGTWFEIKIDEKTNGWVHKNYAEIVEGDLEMPDNNTAQ